MTDQHETDGSEQKFKDVSILEYKDCADEYDRPAGERFVVAGDKKNRHIRCDDTEGFVEIATSVATIELYQPLTKEQVHEWCKSEAGKLALVHWMDIDIYELDKDWWCDQ